MENGHLKMRGMTEGETVKPREKRFEYDREGFSKSRLSSTARTEKAAWEGPLGVACQCPRALCLVLSSNPRCGLQIVPGSFVLQHDAEFLLHGGFKPTTV
jgi:hypothetical protein